MTRLALFLGLSMALASTAALAQRHPLTVPNQAEESPDTNCEDVSDEARELVAIQAARMMSKEPEAPTGTLTDEQRQAMSSSTQALTQQVSQRKAAYDPEAAKRKLLEKSDRFSTPSSLDGKSTVMRGSCKKRQR